MKFKPWMTYTFLTIQILVYLVMTLYGYRLLGTWNGTENSLILYHFGAEYPPSVLQGEYWRLVTPIFIHIGLAHIVLNSVTLYYVGPMLEEWMGHIKFAILYLLSGICGNLMSLLGNQQTISAGASTALFGLFAAYFALYFINQNPYVKAVAKQYAMFIVINILFNLFDARVDIWGHIGGAIGGFILMFILGRRLKIQNT